MQICHSLRCKQMAMSTAGQLVKIFQNNTGNLLSASYRWNMIHLFFEWLSCKTKSKLFENAHDSVLHHVIMYSNKVMSENVHGRVFHYITIGKTKWNEGFNFIWCKHNITIPFFLRAQAVLGIALQQLRWPAAAPHIIQNQFEFNLGQSKWLLLNEDVGGEP